MFRIGHTIDGDGLGIDSNAGTSATGTLVGSEASGKVSLTTGATSLSSGAQLSVYQANSADWGPDFFPTYIDIGWSVTLTPANAAAADLTGIFIQVGVNEFEIHSTVALDPSETYEWYYQVIDSSGWV